MQIGQPGGLEIGARPRVDQRAAISRDPTREPFAGVDGDLLDDLRIRPGRKTAAQRLSLLVVQEQRRARERHEVAEFRGDQRHRVRDAQARAHRLSDFVQRVNLAMGERDVVEHVLLRRLRREAGRRAADRLPVLLSGRRGPPHRLLERCGIELQRRQQLDELLAPPAGRAPCRLPAAAARSPHRSPSPCGTAAPPSARRSNRRPTGSARRAECPLPSALPDIPCHPSARDGSG